MSQIDRKLGFVVSNPKGGWSYSPSPGAGFVDVVAWSTSMELINAFLEKNKDCFIAVTIGGVHYVVKGEK